MVIDEAEVEKIATATAWRAGEKLYRGGAVFGTRSETGGAAGTVTDRGQEHELWTGIVDRRLAGQCPCAGRAKFCAHAVALALDAVRLALPWAEVEPEHRRTDPAAAYPELRNVRTLCSAPEKPLLADDSSGTHGVTSSALVAATRSGFARRHVGRRIR